MWCGATAPRVLSEHQGGSALQTDPRASPPRTCVARGTSDVLSDVTATRQGVSEIFLRDVTATRLAGHVRAYRVGHDTEFLSGCQGARS